MRKSSVRPFLVAAIFAIFGIATAVQCSTDRSQTSSSTLLAWEAGCPPWDGGPLPSSITPIDAGTAVMATNHIPDFINWVAGVPVAQKSLMLSAIATGAADRNIVAAYNTQLDISNFHVTDLGSELVLISIVGQMRQANSVTALLAVVNYSGVILDCSYDAGGGASGGGSDSGPECLLPPNCDQQIRAHATKMIAYIEGASSPLALTQTATIATSHANKWVRRAAIDAYMYNSNDSATASGYLNAHAQSGDLLYIGLPRLYAGMDASDFDYRVSSFYDAHPGELPVTQEIWDAQTDAAIPINCTIPTDF